MIRLETLFREMQMDVAQSHHLSDFYLKDLQDILNEMQKYEKDNNTNDK